MTLADLIPTLRTSLYPGLADRIWPGGAALDEGGDLVVGGTSMTQVAATFGTPCYVLDEADVRQQCGKYRSTLPEMEIAYASKALLTRAVAQWMHDEGLSLDVCSSGELAVARSVGFPAQRIILHGNAKTPEDLKAALSYHVGRIVVDSLDEIDQLASLARDRQRVLIRVTPGVDAHTHRAIATGVEDQKFGFSLDSGAAAEAVRRVLDCPALRLAGLHCHIGSQISRVASFEEAARRMVTFMASLRVEHGIELPQLNLGGGHAVCQQPDDSEFDLTGFACRLRVALHDECQRRGIPLPCLTIEPGRSLVARAGITLYRVVSVKHRRNLPTCVAVDGGMSDNLRPALYQARYTAQLFGRRSRAKFEHVTLVGRHCEAGDVVASDVPLPADIHAGDLLAVPCTGAYNHSLASNYNLVGRPALVAVADARARLLLRRETEEDLLWRDVGI